MLMQDAIRAAVGGNHLDRAEAESVMQAILNGEATPSQIAAFAIALRMKGETVEEVTGFAKVMRSMAAKVPHHQAAAVDTCGTGGDGSGTFNISTTVALVAAGAGVAVAKHGNKAISSRSGSADVLQALGVNVALNGEQAGRCLDEVGICFLFAPAMHGAMKHAAVPRSEMGVRTFFNLLGPLSNPAGAQRQLVGVFEADWVEPIAQVLANLGTVHALVVHGLDGLDELTICDDTRVAEVKDGKVRSFYVNPQELGLDLAAPGDLKGGDATANAAATLGVLKGEAGPHRDIVLLNAAAALVVAGKAATLREGLPLAALSIDSGGAMKKLEALRTFSNTCA
jgi:anthranilate phosphoribosyltransferase